MSHTLLSPLTSI